MLLIRKDSLLYYAKLTVTVNCIFYLIMNTVKMEESKFKTRLCFTLDKSTPMAVELFYDWFLY